MIDESILEHMGGMGPSLTPELILSSIREPRRFDHISAIYFLLLDGKLELLAQLTSQTQRSQPPSPYSSYSNIQQLSFSHHNNIDHSSSSSNSPTATHFPFHFALPPPLLNYQPHPQRKSSITTGVVERRESNPTPPTPPTHNQPHPQIHLFLNDSQIFEKVTTTLVILVNAEFVLFVCWLV